MKTMITVHKCDGSACGLPIRSQEDGIVIVGQIYAGGVDTDSDCPPIPLVGPRPGIRNSASNETALCWSCFHKRVIDPTVTRLTGELASEKRDHQRTRESASSSSSHSSNYNYRSGNGPTGPLHPPELPHYVGVVAALIKTP